MLGLRFCARAFSGCGERQLLFVAVCGQVARGAEDSPEPASGEAHPGLRARGGEEKAQPSRSPEKGEAVGSPSAPLGGGCQLGGQGLQSGKGRASSEDGVKRRRGVFTWSGFRDERRQVTTLPPVLKTLSDEELVADRKSTRLNSSH